ncbi:MAG: hypothetical protein ACFFCZ_06750 [Promethearchaeota archaeon]
MGTLRVQGSERELVERSLEAKSLRLRNKALSKDALQVAPRGVYGLIPRPSRLT